MFFSSVHADDDLKRYPAAIQKAIEYAKNTDFSALEDGRQEIDGDKMYELSSRRVDTRNTHGTGCSYSAAITALLPQHGHVPSAVRQAHAWLAGAIASSGQLAVAGSPEGHGPVHHFHALWSAR